MLLGSFPLAHALEPEAPTAAEMQTWVESRNSAAIRYHWPELNGREQKQTIAWMMESKFSKAQEWKEFYQKEIDRLVQSSRRPEGTCKYVLGLLEALDGSKENLSMRSKLVLNWFASKEIPAVDASRWTGSAGQILNKADVPGLVSFLEADKALHNALDLNLISSFQEFTTGRGRASLQSVATLMRYGYDPQRMTWLSPMLRAEFLSQVSQVQARARTGASEYLPQYSINTHLKLEETMMRPRAMETYVADPQVVAGIVNEAQNLALAQGDTRMLLRNELHLQMRGLSIANPAKFKPDQEMIHAWIKSNPEEVKTYLNEIILAQKTSPASLKVNDVLESIIYEWRGESSATQLAWIKELVLEKGLALTKTGERLLFTEANLTYLFEHPDAYSEKWLKISLDRFEKSLGNEAYQNQLQNALLAVASRPEEEAELRRLFSRIPKVRSTVALGDSDCTFLGNIRKIFFRKKPSTGI
ncbi:MAG: hypothetical protein H7333_00485 [Bdellovibrionales bacterium]|nr:hypothetical protein [Oligoflexia bacterium]